MPASLPSRPLTLLLAAAFLAHSEDATWPQFRGPDSNPVGTHPQLPDRWSTTQNVEWSVEIPGRGWSSPIVTGGKIFLTTAITDGKSKPPQMGTEYSNQYVAELMKQGLSEAEVLKKVYERDIEMPTEVTLHYFLYCLDLQTGKTDWKKEFYTGRPPGGRHRKNSFTSESPITDGKLVYVYATNLGLYAYRLNGEKAWSTPLQAHPVYLDFGTGGSPVLHGNQLVIVNDNEEKQFIAAFDKRTGKQIWRTERDIKEPGPSGRRSGWSTPFVWVHKLRTEIVTIGPGLALSYDLDGKELWRMSGMSTVPVPSAFASDGLLFLDGGLTRSLFAVRPGASGDISLAAEARSNEHVLWSEPRAGTYLPTPVAYEGGLYSLNEKGILSRFDSKTGKLSFKARLHPEAGAFTSSPWAYNGKIFCLSEEGKTFVSTAAETFQLLHVNSLDEMAQASPAIAGDRLLIRTENHLYSIRQKAGR